MEKRPALGKGLSALIPDAPRSARQATVEADVDRLTPNEFQPRGMLDEARLQELAQSIRANGLIQPIIVRKEGDRFQIIAGERRWRAAKLAGLLRVPIIVRDLVPGEKSQLELALVENIQREDLNPIDEALAYKRLADQFELTQEQIAAAVGKDRATIANHMRLLRLPDEVRAEVASGRLSMGHARALLSLVAETEQRVLARDVLARGLSVRETEFIVKKIVESGSSTPREPAAAPPVDADTRAAEERLKMQLGTRVRIVRHGTRGRIEIDFTSEEELIRIFDALTER
jgi:ParB family chromosome partitioning protein